MSAELVKLLTDEPDTAVALESVTTCGQLAYLIPVAQQAGGAGEANAVAGEGAAAAAAAALRPLVVGNTHLFFHPQAAHIRIIQAHTLLAAAAAFADDQQAEAGARAGSGAAPALVLCGDFNSEPFDGAAEYLMKGHLAADHPEWVSGRLFRWGKVRDRIKVYSGPPPPVSFRRRTRVLIQRTQ